MTKKSECGFRIYMPRCGEDGVIIVTSIDTGERVEFRGRPYSDWDESETSDFRKVHDSFKRVDISRLHSDEVETVTFWHGDEWVFVYQMFIAATQCMTREEWMKTWKREA